MPVCFSKAFITARQASACMLQITLSCALAPVANSALAAAMIPTANRFMLPPWSIAAGCGFRSPNLFAAGLPGRVVRPRGVLF
jgi:hypothetical protein